MRLILDAEPPYAPSMEALRLPQSSVTPPISLPSDDAPPWFFLEKPGAPVVLRRYLSTSRRCDVVSKSGRWLLESCLVPKTPQFPEYLHIGWDLAFGDVEPGWCIIYAGARLWSPQLVLRVEDESEDWQRVWTLSDATTRHVWPDELTYALDNGLAQDWGVDDVPPPVWEPDGPWWPLQQGPLSPRVRRFVLDKFNLAVECPSCGGFGKPVVHERTDSPHVITDLGCPIGLMEPDYICECGFSWNVGPQGELLNTSNEPPEDDDGASLTSGEWEEGVEIGSSGPLTYGRWEEAPYGVSAEEYLRDWQDSLLPEVGDFEDHDYETIRRIFGASFADDIVVSQAEHESEMGRVE